MFRTKLCVKVFVGISLVSTFFLPACSSENVEDLAPTPQLSDPVYRSVVLPILRTNCTASCHNLSSPNAGYNFLDSASTRRSALASGDLSGSINHQSGFIAMPIGAAKMSAADIDTVDDWIDSIGGTTF